MFQFKPIFQYSQFSSNDEWKSAQFIINSFICGIFPDVKNLFTKFDMNFFNIWCLMDTLKNPTKCLWRESHTVVPTFFFIYVP